VRTARITNRLRPYRLTANPVAFAVPLISAMQRTFRGDRSLILRGPLKSKPQRSSESGIFFMSTCPVVSELLPCSAAITSLPFAPTTTP